MKKSLPTLCLFFFFTVTIVRAQAPSITVQAGLPAGSGPRNIVHGNGIYLASFGSVFFRSTDGVTWVPTTAPILKGSIYNLPTLAFGAGRFVCVGDSGTISTSPDAVNWTSRSSGTSAYLTDVKFLQGDFYAVGYQATLLHSANGTHWDSLNIGKGAPSDFYNGINYGNGYFVISSRGVNVYSMIYRSGLNTLGSWTADTIGVTSVKFLKGHFYLFDANVAEVSTDAANWTPVNLTSGWPLPTSGFNDSTHVYLLGEYDGPGYSYGIVYSSTDGLLFNDSIHTTIVPAGGLYAGNHDYIFGQYGTERSVDGINYRLLGMNFLSLASNGSNYAGVGFANDQGLISSSADFNSWTNRTPAGATRLTGIVYDGSRYLAVGSGTIQGRLTAGTVYSSPDGLSWTKIGSSPPLNNIMYAAGRYLAVGVDTLSSWSYQTGLYTSTDGISWNYAYPTDSLIQKNINAVRYLNGRFFAVGDLFNDQGPLLLSSADGLHWRNISPHLSFLVEYLTDIVYDGSKYTLIGLEDDSDQDPLQFFSLSTAHINNPDSWGHKGSITSPPSGTLLAPYQGTPFAYSHGHYVGGVNDRMHNLNNYLVYSTDGIHWSNTSLGNSAQFRGMVDSGNVFRMVGGSNVWVTVTFPSVSTGSDSSSKLLISPLKEAIAESPALKVYPNPAAGNTRLELPESGPGMVILYNSAGASVYRQEFNGYTVTLSLRALPKGIYHLSVIQNGKQYYKEILHL